MICKCKAKCLIKYMCFTYIYIRNSVISEMLNCKRKRWLEDQILCNVVVYSFTAKRLLEHRSTWKSTSLPALELTANAFITPAIQFSASQKFLSLLLSSADLIQIFTTLKGKDHHISIRVLVVQCT